MSRKRKAIVEIEATVKETPESFEIIFPEELTLGGIELSSIHETKKP